MNRKRHKNETFKQYRENLKREAAKLKARLAGRFVHVSFRNGINRGEGITYRKES